MSLGLSTIIDTGRALMAALQPITGGRAFGQLRMRAQPGLVLELPAYTYFIPIVDGARHAGWLFKVAEGPNPNRSWTIDDTGNTVVNVMSNIGGVRHNLPQGTFFVTDIDVDGLVLSGGDRPHAVADFQGGSDPEKFGIKDMAMYETFDGPAFQTDLRRSPIRQFPGVLVAFQDMTPADGVAIAQTNQGAVNAGDGKKFFKISFTISIVITKAKGDQLLRMEGLVIANTIASLLNDKHAGDENEPLSNPGGVQIRQLMREDGPQPVYKKFYIYTLLVSCMRSITRIDSRVYNPWLRTTMTMTKPQSPPLVNQGDFVVVNGVKIDMTPNQLDFSIDGTFTRASDGYLWDGLVLRQFGAGERRMINKGFGTLMESAVSNALAAASLDFNLWTPLAAAVVTGTTEVTPLGTGLSQVLMLAADAASGFEYGPIAVAVGQPIVVQGFARGKGNKRQKFRFEIDDGISPIVSGDLDVEPVWGRFRFEATPQAAAVTVRIRNATDAKERTLAVWGASISNGARWGAEYPGTGTKVKDRIAFNPIPTQGQNTSSSLDTPLYVMAGQWHFRYRTPDEVTPDTIGTGIAGIPTLLSVGDGTSDLVSLKLVGTPATGGAALMLATRGAGVVVNLTGVEWNPGTDIEFLFDVPAGKFIIAGTNTHDGEYSFPRYDVDADVANDYLVMGDTTNGGSAPVPGQYILLGSFSTVTSDVASALPQNVVVVNGVPVTYNGAFVVSN